MPNRNETAPQGGYRYSFQGQEHDDEVKGEGNSVNYKYRMHDPRVGRFFAVDPLASQYPQWSPYAFSGNVVIMDVEYEGLEPSKGDPNYGNNIVFTAHKGTINDYPNNSNWHGDYGYNMEAVLKRATNYKLQGSSIKNMILYAHGDWYGAKIGGDFGCGSPPMLSQSEAENYTPRNDYKIYADDIETYLNISGETSAKKKQRMVRKAGTEYMEGMYKDIETLDKLMNTVEDGGTFFMSSCYSGIVAGGADFGLSLSKLNPNVNVIVSKDYVSIAIPKGGVGEGVGLDRFVVEHLSQGVSVYKNGENISSQFKSSAKEILNVFLSSQGEALKVESGNLDTLQNNNNSDE